MQNIPIIWHRKLKPKASGKTLSCASPCSSGGDTAASSLPSPLSPRRRGRCSAGDSESVSSSDKQQRRGSFAAPFLKNSMTWSFSEEQRVNQEDLDHNDTNIDSKQESVVKPEPPPGAGLLFFSRSMSTADASSERSERSARRSRSANAAPAERYARFDAVLSICDTETGPSIEIRTTSDAVQSLSLLETHDLVDFDEKMDLISNLHVGDRLDDRHRVNDDDDIKYSTPKKDTPSAGKYKNAFIERVIPLERVDFAAPGGAFDWENVFHVGSGRLDCGVKVYSSAADYQLIGSGKKVLLFDIADHSPLSRDEVVSHLNALVEWNRARKAYKDQTGIDVDEETYSAVLCHRGS